MSVTMIHAKVQAGAAAEVEGAAKRLFAAIEREQLKGIRYASSKLPDGVTFVILLQLEDGIDNPLGALPEFREFQEGLRNQLSGPPTQEQLTVVGSYRLFD
jgi:hypothetical protein